jgi:hypothetical protein
MQNTVAKGTECHGRLVAISPVGELDLQDRNVVDDGSGNGGDENENRGRKEEEGPNVVNDASPSHLDGVEVGLSIWLVQNEVEGWDVFACGELFTAIPCIDDFSSTTTTLGICAWTRCDARDNQTTNERGMWHSSAFNKEVAIGTWVLFLTPNSAICALMPLGCVRGPQVSQSRNRATDWRHNALWCLGPWGTADRHWTRQYQCPSATTAADRPSGGTAA